MIANDSVSQQSLSFTKHPHILGATATFYTDWVDSIIDEFEATRVDVNAVDRWGNDATKTTYRPSMWGQLAEALSGSFLDPAIALNLGMMDGLTCALYQVPELVYQLLTHPVETLQMLALFAMIPEAAIIMIIPAIYELEEGENPYDLDTELQCHLGFATGWVQGYVGMSILLMFAGKQVMEGIGTAYSRISEILPQIEQECGDIPTLTGKLKYLGIRGATLIGLIKRANAAGVVDGELLYTDVEVGAAQAHVWQEYEEGLTPATRAIVDQHKPEGGALLKGMTPSGIDILNSMDGNTLEKILAFQRSGLTDEEVLNYQAGLFKMKRLGISDTEINEYIDNMDIIGSKPGAFTRSLTGDKQTLASRAVTSVKRDNYKGLLGETRVATYYEGEGRLIELGPENGIVDVRLLGESGGYALDEVKTPTVPLTGEKAGDLAGDARGKFVTLKNNGALTNERKIFTIDTTDAGFADPVNGLDSVKTGLYDRVKLWESKGITDIVDEFDILIKDGSGYHMVKGDVTITNIDGKNVYTLTWRS